MSAASTSAAPQPATAGIPPVVQITTDDLRTLMQGALQAVVQQQAQEREQQARVTSMKDLKLTEPKTFSRRPEDLDDFPNNCELIFSIKGDVYNQDDKKIAYALALIKIGNAGLWKRQYVQEYFASNNGVLRDSWNRFKTRLRDAFKDIGRAEDSMKWLSLSKQGGKMIEEFNTLFRIHGTRAGLQFMDMIYAPAPTAGGNAIAM
jgi:hypothetical protein